MNQRIIPIIGVAFLIILILGGIFLWWPQYEKFREVKAELEVKKIELEQKRAYFADLAAISDKLGDYKEQIARLNDAFPAEISFPDLFNYMQRTVAENGLVLKSLGSSGGARGVATPGEPQSFSFPVSLEGPYSNFKNFLSVLFQNSRLIDVDSLGFSAPAEGKADFSWTLNLSASYLP